MQFKNAFELFTTMIYEQVKDRIGEFVKLSLDLAFDPINLRVGQGMTVFDKVHQYPKNVAILANSHSMSASEIYMLTARQSKKVKIFGETTLGGADTLFLTGDYWTKSPCDEVWLLYTDTRFAHVPYVTIDDIGVQPDFIIDSTVPDYRWVEHVTEVMNSWVTEPEPRRRRGRR